MNPWGLGRTFGGEAESRWVTLHPEACQVLDDGRRVATGCLNNPRYRAFCARVELAEGLRPWFPKLELAVDLDRVPALAEDRERLWAQLSAADFLDRDEKRALVGLPAKGDGQ